MPLKHEANRSLDDAEGRLLDAMRASDVDALDDLIADELEFTLPDGSIIGKQADLESHRTGSTHFESLSEVSRHTVESHDTGTTETVVNAVILWGGARIDATLTYSRFWRKVEGRWRVFSGSATPTPQSVDETPA